MEPLLAAAPTSRYGARRGRPRETPSGHERPHVALVGFMGAGKSSVGRDLAQRAGLRFVDLDEVIVEQAGCSIPSIFHSRGEVGFRACERSALRSVLDSDVPLVIATGGGTFADPSMRGMLQRVARTVFLAASADTLLARMGSAEARAQRPLLAGPDPRATVQRLLQERTPAYEACDFTVSTDGFGPSEVVDELVRVLGLGRSARRARRGTGETAAPIRPTAVRDGSATVPVQSAAGAYDVLLRAEAGDWLVEALLEKVGDGRIAVLSDTTVTPLHAQPLVDALAAAGRAVSLHTFAPGETSKSLSTAARLYDELLDAGLDRNDWLVAVGGGVVGDLTGFVASTLLRGVPYVQVPTTTLAAVDASVGGKTAVNTARGKNLVGTFYPPRGVLVSLAHLRTQTQRAHAAGLVEALKMAACLDAGLFASMTQRAAALLAHESEAMLDVLARAVDLKAGVVSRDEKEAGERAVLNYGHTIGHAIEVGEQYRLLHGEAVALGMMAESEWAESRGVGAGVRQTLEQALLAFGAPTDWRHSRIDAVALQVDKKRRGTQVQLPVVPAIGSFELRRVPLRDLLDLVGWRSA